jgi:hypothetical protein
MARNIVNRVVDSVLRNAVYVINNCIADSSRITEIMNCIESIDDPDLREFTKQVFMTYYAPSLGFADLDWEGLRKITRSPYALASYLLERLSKSTQSMPTFQTQAQNQTQAFCQKIIEIIQFLKKL